LKYTIQSLDILHLQTKGAGANLLLKFILLEIPKDLDPFNLKKKRTVKGENLNTVTDTNGYWAV